MDDDYLFFLHVFWLRVRLGHELHRQASLTDLSVVTDNLLAVARKFPRVGLVTNH